MTTVQTFATFGLPVIAVLVGVGSLYLARRRAARLDAVSEAREAKRAAG